MLASGRPTLCFNLKCDNELHALPDVFAFIKPNADPRVPPIAMAMCSRCGQLSDGELHALMREGFAKLHGFGPPPGTGRIETEFSSCVFTIAGVEIAVAIDEDSKPLPNAAVVFSKLLETQKLPAFIAFRHGVGNCHSIVGHLRRDLAKLGLEDMFSYKRGSSLGLRTETDPEGLHSWIETDGWVIDAANGAQRSVLVMKVDDYRKRLQLVDIVDIPADR
ncbi:hypothetical protein BSZ21_38955 [Bradyrhizobium canariense]|nr:hypothetical protein BSZ21_38955 [Bradyrhizobium canariense]